MVVRDEQEAYIDVLTREDFDEYLEELEEAAERAADYYWESY